jgi:hypothetical protein
MLVLSPSPTPRGSMVALQPWIPAQGSDDSRGITRRLHVRTNPARQFSASSNTLDAESLTTPGPLIRAPCHPRLRAGLHGDEARALSRGHCGPLPPADVCLCLHTTTNPAQHLSGPVSILAAENVAAPGPPIGTPCHPRLRAGARDGRTRAWLRDARRLLLQAEVCLCLLTRTNPARHLSGAVSILAAENVAAAGPPSWTRCHPRPRAGGQGGRTRAWSRGHRRLLLQAEVCLVPARPNEPSTAIVRLPQGLSPTGRTRHMTREEEPCP